MRVGIIFFFIIVFIVPCNSQQNNISAIINNYTPVIRLDKCENDVRVDDPSFFNTNDTVLIIQMKGAIVDTTNTVSFGNVVNYNGAGLYEFNIVKDVLGNRILFKNQIVNAYDVDNGKVQLVRVPYYNNVVVSGTLTCSPWDGNKGGILVFNAANSITLNANIDVTGKGFWGGQAKNTNLNYTNCFQNDFFYPAQSLLAAPKGESIAILSNSFKNGKGKNAGGGGGGMDHNSGGGGGGNGGKGGLGGYQLYECNYTFFDNRGLGGDTLSYWKNRFFLGSGGGAGNCNNGFYNPTANTNFNGGAGGGMIIIGGTTLQANGYSILAKGDSAYELNSSNVEAHDGMGGGGSGGMVFLDIKNYIGNAIIDIRGGKGGDMRASIVNGKIGPGGGGGGGVAAFSNFTKPPQTIINKAGGKNGVQLLNNNDPFGATSGNDGMELYNLRLKIDTILYKKIIDSVKIDTTGLQCNVYSFFASLYSYKEFTNISYQWDFGDNSTSTQKNASHNFAISGPYNVTLVATDSLGCSDTAHTLIIPVKVSVQIDSVPLFCKDALIPIHANVQGSNNFHWSPGFLVNDSLATGTTISTNKRTKIYAIATSGTCNVMDSVLLSPYIPQFGISANQKLCENIKAQLIASGGKTYSWTPVNLLSNSNIYNPIASNTTTQLFSVFITDSVCNDTVTLSTLIEIIPNPTLSMSKSNDIDCSNSQAIITVQSDGTKLIWRANPALTNSSKITVQPVTTTTYSVTAMNQIGCEVPDSITVYVSANNATSNHIPNAFTPNNDGVNDCFNLKYLGGVTYFQCSVYNRWGEKVYEFKNAQDCWNGRYKGLLQPVGNYVYYLKAVTLCGTVERKGNILLLY